MLIWFYCQPWDFLLVFMPLCVLLYGIVVYTAKKEVPERHFELSVVCVLFFG